MSTYDLLSKPLIESILQPLNSLLSSPRPDDSISEELVEMIGFEEIELSMEILNERANVCQEVKLTVVSLPSCDLLSVQISQYLAGDSQMQRSSVSASDLTIMGGGKHFLRTIVSDVVHTHWRH